MTNQDKVDDVLLALEGVEFIGSRDLCGHCHEKKPASQNNYIRYTYSVNSMSMPNRNILEWRCDKCMESYGAPKWTSISIK